jgi:cytochrome c oxidase assembly protein subunit 15
MLVVMVFIGGLTRLTGSGLSIVEWKPILGILPPLSQADWLELFAKYQTSPEFMKINSHMDVEAFKGIFWLEYIHRVWGRLMGFVLLIPTALVLKNSVLRQKFLSSIIFLWMSGTSQIIRASLLEKEAAKFPISASTPQWRAPTL